ncbi:tax1-binding protein 1 [Rhinatrema bivittatum]|uniref:tax1-binding protein 1 n=1 Tax=Rhinatrema bivittatum TaxID=194408 RepID=UPI00112705CC|nr:tax1-binding protein 1 [Rhinatrema bivittatum]XP_029445044.1 tax1-binding protein 1 [Rhinatrema bivittatum]XP_029445045.1 tax1-binding protein 1 [Rhinatrema bivittatum]
MSSSQEVPSPVNTMQTSNFAHVIFQNVAKSYLPHVPLECHYTLTQYIHPHQKDWVGIFKVGWSTARDYYTFLWSPMPENYVEGSTVNCVLSFQGYYLPNDDGEFYQFCYVTHKGEIRGASTPFQFRTSSPVEELLTMEDEGHSDMLVVTTKAGLLELKIEKTLKEKEELLKITTALEKETAQLRQQIGRLENELSNEKEKYEQLQTEQKVVLEASETIKCEREDLKKQHEEMTSKVVQLEEDILSVTQKAITKETELDSLKGKLKKVTLEKEQLECQLKNEKDEKELYKVHLKNTEIENTKLVTEVQTLKNLDASKENKITLFEDEVGRLQLCLADKENLQRDLLLNSANKEEAGFLKEQLRKAEDQIQASRQENLLLTQELSDAVNVRDKTMADLHNARLENENVKKQLADALTELQSRESQLQKAQAAAEKNEQVMANSTTEQELRKEVEDLKLRLQMAADHYKEKFKECQKLQKQVIKLTEQSKVTDPSTNSDTDLSAFGDVQLPPVSEVMIKEQVREMNKEIAEKTEKYKKCKQMLADEKAKCSTYAEELAKVELKWKEQLKVSENVKLQLSAAEDQYKIHLAKVEREIQELKLNLERVVIEREQVENKNKALERRLTNAEERVTEGQSCQGPSPVFNFLNPYSEEKGTVPAVPSRLPVLQYGNPYAAQETRDGADGAFYPDEIQRPPVRTSSWELEENVVCSQPSRNLSRPDGLEDPDENNDTAENVHVAQDPQSFLLQERGTGFCFDSSFDVQKKCPLCEVMFPPNYDQSKFEEHVESHWKVCPMCSEQFPPDYDQQGFERHVQTHFDGHVLNFE